jgi:hypothetical protein
MLLRRCQRKALVALLHYFAARLPVRPNAADIGHEDARLAGNVRPQVPGVGAEHERRVGHFGDVRRPLLFGFGCCFDSGQVVLAQVIDAVRDPLDMLFD